MKTWDESDDQVIGMWYLEPGYTCIVRPQDDDPTLPPPQPSIEWAWQGPTDTAARLETLPARAPIRRERQVRWQSVGLLVAFALAGLFYAFLYLFLRAVLPR